MVPRGLADHALFPALPGPNRREHAPMSKDGAACWACSANYFTDRFARLPSKPTLSSLLASCSRTRNAPRSRAPSPLTRSVSSCSPGLSALRQTRAQNSCLDPGQAPCSWRSHAAHAPTGQTSFSRRLRSGCMGKSGTAGILIHAIAFSGAPSLLLAAAAAAATTASFACTCHVLHFYC